MAAIQQELVSRRNSHMASTSNADRDLVQTSVSDDFEVYRFIIRPILTAADASSSGYSLEIEQVQRFLERCYFLDCVAVVQNELFAVASHGSIERIRQCTANGRVPLADVIMRELDMEQQQQPPSGAQQLALTVDVADLLEHRLVQHLLELRSEVHALQRLRTTMMTRIAERDKEVLALKQQLRASVNEQRVLRQDVIAAVQANHEQELATTRHEHAQELATAHAKHTQELAINREFFQRQLGVLGADNDHLETELAEERRERMALQDDLEVLKSKHRERCADVAQRDLYVDRYLEPQPPK